MTIKGKHTLETTVENLWPLLLDPDVLARISPGVSKMERIEEDNYNAISEINIGPVRGSFTGNLSIKDKREHDTMTLELNQKSKIGGAQASIIMNLERVDTGQTLIHYDGSARVSGKLASMGQRILGGVVKTLTRQVFKELEAILLEQQVTGAETGSGSRDDKDQKNIIELILIKLRAIWKSLLK